MFLYLSSQTCRPNTSLPACSFYYCLTLKKNTTEYEAGGSTALMILPKCLLTCGFIFFFTCYFCTSFNTERIFGFFGSFTCFSFYLKHQCTCCLGHLECWEICFSLAVCLKTAGLNACTWESKRSLNPQEGELPSLVFVFLRSSLTLRC